MTSKLTRSVFPAAFVLAAAGFLPSPTASATVTASTSNNATTGILFTVASDNIVSATATSNTTPSPFIDVTPSGATADPYTAVSTSSLAAPYTPAALQGGALGPAAANTANGGSYDINNNGSTLTLTLTNTRVVSYIAIYNGYDNRDDGTYTVGYANVAGTNITLGTYAITSPVTNANVVSTDDILLQISPGVTATAITTGFSNGTDTDLTNSFEDIQIFTVPEPSTYAIAFLGFGALVASQLFRRRRA